MSNNNTLPRAIAISEVRKGDKIRATHNSGTIIEGVALHGPFDGYSSVYDEKDLTLAQSNRVETIELLEREPEFKTGDIVKVGAYAKAAHSTPFTSEAIIARVERHEPDSDGDITITNLLTGSFHYVLPSYLQKVTA